MSREFSLELLNATHRFPCTFMFKVIGVHREDFAAQLLDAIRLEIGVEQEIRHSQRATPAGRHVAVTLEPQVESAEQVLAIYERIRIVEGIVFTL